MTSTTEIINEIVHTFESSPPKGDKGDPGEAGISGNTISIYPAGINMSGHRIVIVENDILQYADSSNLEHSNLILGMTLGAVLQGNLGTVQTYGTIEEPSWNWTLKVPIWLSTQGLIQQTSPSSGFSLIIGFPTTSTKLFINIREPIFLI